MPTCYRCEAEATTVEHVPPRCLFPERKDVPCLDLKKNLITVPSCRLHNCDKSGDDQYLLCLLAAMLENNVTAQRQFETKIVRSLKRDHRLTKSFLREPIPVQINQEKTAAVKVDVTRARSALQSIAYGLYFYTYKEKWAGKIKIVLCGLFKREGNYFYRHPREEEMKELVEAFFSNEPRVGENQEIFFFQIYRDVEVGALVIRMVFYGGFEVMALSGPAASCSG